MDWGEDGLDFFLVDTPPGTSDEHLSIVQYLGGGEGIDGAVIVTTPQEVSLADVRKEIDFCRKVGVKVVGVIENMSGFVCPKCAHETTILPASSGGARKLCEDMGIPLLGKIPLDPRIGQSCDEGMNVFDEDNALMHDSPAVKVYNEVIDKIIG